MSFRRIILCEENKNDQKPLGVFNFWIFCNDFFYFCRAGFS